MLNDTRFLRAFYIVCTEGGFSRAAVRLHCTQPAVTYQVRTLERDLGVPLFERGGRRAHLTPAGRRLLVFCQRFFAELDLLVCELAGGVSARAEPLRIAAVAGFGRYVLFPALTSLLAAGADGSGPSVDLRFRTAAEVFALVERGEVDLGVVYLPKISNYLAFRPLREEELVLIAAPSLMRGALRDLALDAIDSYRHVPFVTYLEGDYVFGRWFEVQFGVQPTTTVSVHQFDELEEVVAAVALGTGASIVPLDAVRDAVTRGTARVLHPVGGRRCMNQVFAVTRAGTVPRPQIDGLLAALMPASPRPSPLHTEAAGASRRTHASPPRAKK